MNRWALLEHKILKHNYKEFHYDFLVERGSECLTWKMFQLPTRNGNSVEILNQSNHRLIWLFQDEKELSRNRGFVRRIDYGCYINSASSLNNDQFSLLLDGNLLMGLLQKNGNQCQLTQI